jgi:hypothetical protein
VQLLKTMAPAAKERRMRIDECLPVRVAMPAQRAASTGLLAFTLVYLTCGAAGTLLVVALLHMQPSRDPESPPPPPALWPRYMAYPGGFDLRRPAGTQAGDFAGLEVTSGQQVRLSDFRGRKPVVLILGSNSSNFLRTQAGPLQELYQNYRDRAEFLFVYIREGHVVPSAGPPGDRREQVRQALDSYRLTMPCVLDSKHADAERHYRAFPQRLVIVGVDGRYALDAGHGLPCGWDLTEVEAWLERLEAP